MMENDNFEKLENAGFEKVNDPMFVFTVLLTY